MEFLTQLDSKLLEDSLSKAPYNWLWYLTNQSQKEKAYIMEKLPKEKPQNYDEIAKVVRDALLNGQTETDQNVKNRAQRAIDHIKA